MHPVRRNLRRALGSVALVAVSCTFVGEQGFPAIDAESHTRLLDTTMDNDGRLVLLRNDGIGFYRNGVEARALESLERPNATAIAGSDVSPESVWTYYSDQKVFIKTRFPGRTGRRENVASMLLADEWEVVRDVTVGKKRTVRAPVFPPTNVTVDTVYVVGTHKRHGVALVLQSSPGSTVIQTLRPDTHEPLRDPRVVVADRKTGKVYVADYTQEQADKPYVILEYGPSLELYDQTPMYVQTVGSMAADGDVVALRGRASGSGEFIRLFNTQGTQFIQTDSKSSTQSPLLTGTATSSTCGELWASALDASDDTKRILLTRHDVCVEGDD